MPNGRRERTRRLDKVRLRPLRRAVGEVEESGHFQLMPPKLSDVPRDR